jgi:CBS domain-containing protein
MPQVESPARAPTGKRLGDDVCVGEAMGERHVSVEPGVAARALAEALRVEPVLAALVVDESDRLIGAIERGRAMLANGRDSAMLLGESSPFVAESASLAEAIERLVTMHLRFLPVVDARGRVVGLLSDLDTLRWVATFRRPGS